MNLILSTIHAFTADDIDTIEQGVGTSNIRDLTTLLDGAGATGRLGVVDLFIFIAGALFTVYLSWGGIKLMTSAGEPRAVGEAKQIITNALVGLLIVIFSYFIVRIIGIALGLETVQLTF